MNTSDRQNEFARYLEKCQRSLYGYIFALVKNPDDTQDVYQQTCLTLWAKFDEFDGRSKFSTWACGVARNHVRDFYKRQSRHRARFSQAFDEQLALLAAEIPLDRELDRREALDECIKEMPEPDQSLVHDCYSGEFTVPQVAERLDRSTRGLYGTLRKLREGLLRCVDRKLRTEEVP